MTARTHTPNGGAGFCLLVNRSDANRELLRTTPATPKIPAIALPVPAKHRINVFALAMRADRLSVPALFLEKLDGGCFIRAGQREPLNHFGLFQFGMYFFLHLVIMILDANSLVNELF